MPSFSAERFASTEDIDETLRDLTKQLHTDPSDETLRGVATLQLVAALNWCDENFESNQRPSIVTLARDLKYDLKSNNDGLPDYDDSDDDQKLDLAEQVDELTDSIDKMKASADEAQTDAQVNKLLSEADQIVAKADAPRTPYGQNAGAMVVFKQTPEVKTMATATDNPTKDVLSEIVPHQILRDANGTERKNVVNKNKQMQTAVKKFHEKREAASKSAMEVVELFPNKREHVITLVQRAITALNEVHEAIYSLDTDSERKAGIASVKKMCEHLGGKTEAFNRGANIIGQLQAEAHRLFAKQEQEAARIAAARRGAPSAPSVFTI